MSYLPLPWAEIGGDLSRKIEDFSRCEPLVPAKIVKNRHVSRFHNRTYRRDLLDHVLSNQRKCRRP